MFELHLSKYFVSLPENARVRRKSIATGKQPSMETPPTAPPQPFRQSVSNPPSRPRSLPPSLSLSLPPFEDPPYLLPRQHICRRSIGNPGTPPLPLPLPRSLPLSLSRQPWPQCKRGSSTPPLPRSLPLSPCLSLMLPPSLPPSLPSPSPPFALWAGDWRLAGSTHGAVTPFIAPLPSVEVCDSARHSA